MKQFDAAIALWRSLKASRLLESLVLSGFTLVALGKDTCFCLIIHSNYLKPLFLCGGWLMFEIGALLLKASYSKLLEFSGDVYCNTAGMKFVQKSADVVIFEENEANLRSLHFQMLRDALLKYKLVK